MQTPQTHLNRDIVYLKTNSPLLGLAAILLLTALIYAQVASFSFLHFDDDTYVFENPAVLQGLSWANVHWAFTHGVSGHWHPLTILSHMLDVSLFGADHPGYHHLTNLALHLANVALLYALLRRLLRTSAQSQPLAWMCLAVTALFAWHPIHVESVAWISTRKDVLSEFFGLLTLLAYASYAQGRTQSQKFAVHVARYLLVMALFACGLMSKAILVTLPAGMLLIDFWPLRRYEIPIASDSPDPNPMAPMGRLSLRRIGVCLLEKTPLFALSYLSSALTLKFMSEGSVLVSSNRIPLFMRIQNALISYVIYLRRLVAPIDLATQYVYPRDIQAWQWIGALIALLLITAIATWQWRQRPWLLVGWFWYLGTILPVSGLMQAGLQPMADRYAYISFPGLYVMAVGLCAELVQHWNIRTRVVGSAVAGIAVVMVWITFIQVGYWHDTISLFTRCLAIDDNNYFAHNNLGGQFRDLAKQNLGKGAMDETRHDFEIALHHLQRAHELSPDLPESVQNLYMTYFEMGDYPDAGKWCAKSIRNNPGDLEALDIMGWILLNLHRPSEALKYFDQASKTGPSASNACMGAAMSHFAMGEIDKADASFKAAVDLVPDDFKLRFNRGVFYFKLARFSDAAEQFEVCARLDPGNAAARNLLQQCQRKLNVATSPATQP